MLVRLFSFLIFTIYSSLVWGAEFKECVPFEKGDRSTFIEIDASGCKLSLKKGDDTHIVSSLVSFDKDKISPSLEYKRENGICKIKIYAKRKDKSIFTDDSMSVYITPKIPISLSVHTGTNSNIDLTGLTVEELKIFLGIGNTILSVNKKNPISCKEVRIHGNAAVFSSENLGNLDFEIFYFNLTAGIATLDMSGEYRGIKRMEVQTGPARVEIILPENIGVRLKPGGLFYKDIKGLSMENGWYVRPVETETCLLIHIDGGPGILSVKNEE